MTRLEELNSQLKFYEVVYRWNVMLKVDAKPSPAEVAGLRIGLIAAAPQNRG